MYSATRASGPGPLLLDGRSHSVRSPFDRFQIYGERCSGTHFITKLLERNVWSARFTEEYGFKHWFVADHVTINPCCLVIVVARDPREWCRSFHQQPWHAAPSVKAREFSRFIREEWIGGDGEGPEFEELGRERDPITGRRFSSIWHLRTAKYTNWLSLEGRGTAVLPVAYERAASDPKGFLSAVARLPGMALHREFSPIETYKGLRAQAYAPARYDPLTAQDLAHIENQIDPAIEGTFGYAFGNEARSDAGRAHIDMSRNSAKALP